jgi:hypothetical protein
MSDDGHAEKLQREIEAVRENLGGLVSELDHRRHDALNVGLQVRRHAVPLAVAGLAVLGLAAGGTALMIRRERARRSLSSRAASLGQAMKRIVDHPERQAPPPPTIGSKVLAAVATAAASILARRLIQHLMSTDRSSARR